MICYNCNIQCSPVLTYPHRDSTNINICINCFTFISNKLTPIYPTNKNKFKSISSINDDFDSQIKTLKKALLMKVNLKYNRKNNIKH